MAAYDLHIHSGYSSDGELPVAAIVDLCAARGLDAFSLTDHNSVRCWPPPTENRRRAN